MKRMLIIPLILFMLTACTASRSADVTKTDVPQGREPELVFSSYRQGNTVIYCPRMQGLDDAQRQSELNEEILNDAKNVIGLFSDDVVCITVDYEIVAYDDDKIVIKYTGHGCPTPDCGSEQTVSYTSEIYL